jgi:hypothetical protein
VHEYRDFEPGSSLKSYLHVASEALFDTQSFFAVVVGSCGLLRPTLFLVASCAWGAALFALPTTLEVALEIYVSLFGNPKEVRGGLLSGYSP